MFEERQRNVKDQKTENKAMKGRNWKKWNKKNQTKDKENNRTRARTTDYFSLLVSPCMWQLFSTGISLAGHHKEFWTARYTVNSKFPNRKTNLLSRLGQTLSSYPVIFKQKKHLQQGQRQNPHRALEENILAKLSPTSGSCLENAVTWQLFDRCCCWEEVRIVKILRYTDRVGTFNIKIQGIRYR